jgi:hypothetical protein
MGQTHLALPWTSVRLPFRLKVNLVILLLKIWLTKGRGRCEPIEHTTIPTSLMNQWWRPSNIPRHRHRLLPIKHTTKPTQISDQDPVGTANIILFTTWPDTWPDTYSMIMATDTTTHKPHPKPHATLHRVIRRSSMNNIQEIGAFADTFCLILLLLTFSRIMTTRNLPT